MSQIHPIILQTQSYSETLELQLKYSDQVREGKYDGVVLFVEHPKVITLGRRAVMQSEVKHTNIEQLGFEIFKTDRGGEATIHSPGQLVIYPILPIRKMSIGVKHFIEIIFNTTILTLKDYGIEAKSDFCNPGIYTSIGKLGFIGIRVDRGVTRHGLAINFSNDLSLFQWIRPCGVSTIKLDRVCNHSNVQKDEFVSQWFAHCQSLFEQATKLTLKN